MKNGATTVFEEIKRPQVAKGSNAEGKWARGI
jgi:hypothetical protein